MTKKEFLKYNQEMYDNTGNRINIGDTVVINNHYGDTPLIGKVDHFIGNRKVAVVYNWCIIKGRGLKDFAYRKPHTIIKIKSGRKKRCLV